MKLLSTLALAAMAMPAFAQGQGAFKFEDYTERTAFEDTINQRYPIGSSYLVFKKDIIRAGAKSSRDMYDISMLHTHTFVKQQRPTTGRNFIHIWSITVTAGTDNIITAISPSLVIQGSVNTDF